MRNTAGFIPALISALFLSPAAVTAQESSRAILVLDASGSMWGQIDGKAKITIAQEVIADLLQSLPATTELGLTVYGHRRKGDCGDIETMILPNGDQRAAIAAAVNGISPKGKTPLSAAVIAAAEALRYTEEKATVILVSDGKETCNLNTCLVGRSLEEAGIDFTAHVIGFDVSDPADRAELQCLAEETGGTFTTASNAAELSAALAVVAEPEPVTAFDLTFIATEGAGGPVISDGLVWSLGLSDTGAYIARAQPGPNIGFAQIPVGTALFVQVVRQGDGASAELKLVVQNNTPATSVLVLPEPAPEPQALTAIAREESTNRRIETGLNWTVTEPDGTVLIDDQPLQRAEVNVLPGEYQISVTRPEDGASASRRVLVGDRPLQTVLKLPLIVVPAPLTLNAREKGTNRMISRDLVWTLYDRDGKVIVDHVTGPATRTEVLPGRYRVEVLRLDDERTEEVEFAVKRGGTTLTVAFPPYLPPATLEAPGTAVAGSQVLVDWTGPNEEGDFITIADPDSAEAKYRSYEYTRSGPTVTLTMPAEPGQYELRYVLSESRQALVRRVIEVTLVEATLNAPDSAAAGASVSVDWTGPDYQNDYIAVSEIGSAGGTQVNYSYTRKGSPVDVAMPTKPGEYELRYVMGNGRTVLAARPISVGVVSATLNFPDKSAAGETIVVQWTGPDYRNDYIAVAKAGAPDRKYITYSYTREGSPLKLVLPMTPGEYELRYIVGQGTTVIARSAITLEPVSASLQAPASVVAGSMVGLEWTGPDYRNDFVAIARTDMKDTKYLTYSYTREGSPLSVQVPSYPGTYELRYIAAGKPRTILTRSNLQVTEVSASLQAEPGATAGGTIAVTWEGPDYRSDYIALGRVGEEKYLTYAYTRGGSPVILEVPDTAGAYEIRYVVSHKKRVIATIGLTVE